MSSKRGQVVELPASSVRKQRALELMLLGRTDTSIAAELRVNRRTLYRWRADPEFGEELEERRNELRDAFFGRVMSMGDAAADALDATLRGYRVNPDGTTTIVKPDMARVKAVQVWAEMVGIHKNAPAAPVSRTSEIEDATDLAEVLDGIPEAELAAALERKRAKVSKRRALIESVPKPPTRPGRKAPPPPPKGSQ